MTLNIPTSIKRLLVPCLWLFCASTQAQNVSFAPYPEPANTEVFAPGILSNSYYQRDLAFSPDGKSIVYSHVISVGGTAVLVERKIEDGQWSLPVKLPFSTGSHYDIEPFFDPNGDKLYYASNRSGNTGFDIWVVERATDGTWGTPTRLGNTVNTNIDEFYPAVDGQGIIYWTTRRDGGAGGEDIWMASPEGDDFTDPKPVPGDLNTNFDEFNAHINPAGSRIVFSSFGRPNGNGGGDIYTSRISGDTWGNGIKRGADVNSASLDYCPAFSLDGRYFFFTSEKQVPNSNNDVADALDVAGIVRMLASPAAGNIYWKKF